MAANLGSLIVHLGADTATLQSDLGRANAIFQRQAEAMRKTAVQLGTIIGTGIGAAAVATTALVKTAINNADELSKLSVKVGIATESLSALKYQAGLADVELAGLQTGLVRFARTAADAAGGGKQQVAVFEAMGISVRDATGSLKPMDTLLSEVADKFAGYKDGTGKAALATQLFGRAGADLIPMLNEGAAGMAAAAKEAGDFGLIVTDSAGKAAEQFNDNLTRLAGVATGFGNQLAERLLPSLVGLTDQMAENARQSGAMSSAADGVATALQWIAKAAIITKGAIEGLTNFVAASVDTLIGFGQIAAGVLTNIGHATAGALLAAGGQFAEAKAQFDLAGQALGEGWEAGANRIKTAWASANQGIGDAIATADGLVAAMDKPKAAMGEFANVIGGVGPIAKQVDAPIVQLGGSVSKAGGHALKAARDTITWTEALRDAGNALERLQDMAARAADENIDLAAKLAGADDAQISYNRALREANAEYEKLLELGPPSAEAVAALGRAAEEAGTKLDLTRQLEDQGRAFEAYRDQIAKTRDMWGSWADAVFDAVTQSGNFLKNLLSNLKQIVTQMLREWFRTRVIGMFTGGGGGMGSLVSAGAGMVMYSGGGFGAGVDTAANFGSTAGGGTANTLFGDSTTWIASGKKLWDGFSTGISNFWNGSSGSLMAQPGGTGLTYNMPGAGSAGYNGTYGGYGSGFGQALGIAGGVYAGYSRYQSAGGGAAGVAGGLTYGVGTYALGAGMASAAAGTGFAAGVSGAFAAIPVVGWIALAAMAVDYLSGGKLFGTKGKLDHSSMSLDVGAEGISLAQSFTLKGQKALFGGAKWTTENVTPDAEAVAAANAFFDAILSNREDFAKAFNAEVGTLVGGTFTAEFDKHGDLKSSSATVMGVTYDGATQEQFAQLLGAENMIDVLSQFDSKLQDMAATFRGNIDAITDFANAAAVAQTVLHDGMEFLALGADQTLTSVLALAQGMQTANETLEQAIQRIAQAQAQYDQFVGQFAAPTTYVDDFEAALSGINQQMLANIDQANALARAAGAEGASTQDLINIHARAAEQFAALVMQLEASAQSLAYAMGLTAASTLDQVNGEIAALEARAQAGSGPVRQFGDAMQETARRATDAINLLLGDLSPLNDAEKLQKALQGLYAGTVSADQVLQIGRRLYASSSQYEALFNQVSQVRPQGSMVGNPGVGPTAGGGLSASEREHLNDLYEQQAQFLAQQDYTNAQTLGQQIAEIAAANGETYEDVLSRLGIDSEELADRLHLDNADQLDAYLDTVQAQLDSNGENTTSIVDAIERLGDRLLGIVDPEDRGHSGHARPGAPESPDGGGRGHSSHGRNLTDEDAEAIGESVGRHVGREFAIRDRR